MARPLEGILAGFRRRRGSARTEMGVGGTTVFGGFLQTEEKNARLTGVEKYRTFSDILANINIVAAGTRYFLNLVSKASWRVNPADDSSQAVEFAELIEDMMSDMDTPWHRIVRRASMYRYYGFSMQEWTAKRRDDDVIGMRDVDPRPQVTIERWDIDINGEVIGVVQRSPQTQEELYIPRTKLIYMVDDSLNDTPEGLGLFRHIVEASQRLSRYQELEGFGFETDLRGIPIGRVPFQDLEQAVRDGIIKDADKQAAEKPMMDFVKNHIKNPQLGMILDSVPYRGQDDAASPSQIPKWDLDIVKGAAGSSGQKEVAEAIIRVNREIARVLGVENLLLGEGEGSFALAKDKSNNFAVIVDSTLTELEETFEKDFVERIFDLNGWDKELMPELKTETVQFRDIEQITGALRDMAQAGAVLAPDDPAIEDVRDLLGLSKPIVADMEEDVSLRGDETEEEDVSSGDEDEDDDVDDDVAEAAE